MIVAGIDVGSLSTNAVLLNGERETLSYSIVYTGARSKDAARESFEQALATAGIPEDEVSFTLSTGYGREIVPFADAQVTEITCHGLGAHFLFPDTRTVLDIGGQDSKAIRISSTGKVLDFAMNDKCAAGTGRFLEVMARALEIELYEMGLISLQANRPISISSMCTVFAESEVVSSIAQGCAVEDIAYGLHMAVANRTAGLIKRVGLQEELTMTGGVAKNVGVVHAVQEKLDMTVNVYEEPQIVGALGAALIALRRVGGR
jgi:predicted CoA-substrate-specific enzyme activase